MGLLPAAAVSAAGRGNGRSGPVPLLLLSGFRTNTPGHAASGALGEWGEPGKLAPSFPAERAAPGALSAARLVHPGSAAAGIVGNVVRPRPPRLPVDGCLLEGAVTWNLSLRIPNPGKGVAGRTATHPPFPETLRTQEPAPSRRQRHGLSSGAAVAGRPLAAVGAARRGGGGSGRCHRPLPGRGGLHHGHLCVPGGVCAKEKRRAVTSKGPLSQALP